MAQNPVVRPGVAARGHVEIEGRRMDSRTGGLPEPDAACHVRAVHIGNKHGYCLLFAAPSYSR